MGILNVDNIQPVGGGTTITLNSSEINVGAGITFESNGQAIYAGVTTFASNINLGGDVIHSGDNTKIRFPANDTITFETSGSEKLRITSNGKVGIGTINPQQLLEVQDRSGGTLIGLSVGTQYGNAGFGGYNNYPAIMNNVANPLIYCDTNNDRTIFFGDTVGFGTTCAFRVNGAERLRVDSSGHVTKPSQAMFSASGTGSSWTYFSSGSGWYSLGDAAIGGTNHNLDHSWTTTGRVGVGVRGVTSSGASVWENAKARFTAPVTGFYFFEINLYLRTFGGGKTFHVQPWVESSDSQYYTSNVGVIRNSSDSTTGNTQQYPNSVMRSIVLQLTANQTFQWAVYAEGTNNFQTYQGYAHQSGYLIG